MLIDSFVSFFFRTVIEKISTETAQTIFRVTVSSSKIILAYQSLFGQREVEFTEDISPLIWTHIGIQVSRSKEGSFKSKNY